MAQARSPDPAITLRAIVLGVGTFAAVVHLLNLGVQAQLSVMALMSFVFWLFFNVVLKTFVPSLALSRGELLTVFITAFVASSIPANGDVSTCDRCGGRMRVIAALTEPASIRRYLQGMGLPVQPPPIAPPRPPPQAELEFCAG